MRCCRMESCQVMGVCRRVSCCCCVVSWHGGWRCVVCWRGMWFCSRVVPWGDFMSRSSFGYRHWVRYRRRSEVCSRAVGYWCGVKLCSCCVVEPVRVTRHWSAGTNRNVDWAVIGYIRRRQCWNTVASGRRAQYARECQPRVPRLRAPCVHRRPRMVTLDVR